VHDARDERDRSPSYRLGFGDAAPRQAAKGTGAPRSAQRNEMLYSSDPDTRAGWLSGHTNAQPRRWFADQPALLTISSIRSDRLSSNLRLAGESVLAYNPCTTHFCVQEG